MARRGHDITKRNVPLEILREIWAKPCVICGCTFRVCADHITPYSKGGTSERENLQPLCWLCNAKKKNRLTNEELRTWFEANKDAIREKQTRAERNQFVNPYDG